MALTCPFMIRPHTSVTWMARLLNHPIGPGEQAGGTSRPTPCVLGLTDSSHRRGA